MGMAEGPLMTVPATVTPGVGDAAGVGDSDARGADDESPPHPAMANVMPTTNMDG